MQTDDWPEEFRGCASFTDEEADADFNRVLDKVEAGYSPVVITKEGKPYLLVFTYTDYMARFGALYTQEERDKLEADIRAFREDEGHG